MGNITFIKDILDEYILILKNRILYLFHPDLPPFWNSGTRGDVVLVPGLHENWIFLASIANKLQKDGYRIHLPENYNSVESVDSCVMKVVTYVNKYSLKNIVLLSHSKGGIVAKKVMEKVTEDVVRLSISISTPYKGSRLAYLLPTAWELLPTSGVFSKTLNDKEVNRRVINFYPSFDNHVQPHDSLKLGGAVNRELPLVGHTRILEDKKTISMIVEEIEKRS